MASVLLRMPDALLKRIDAARRAAEQEAGWPIDRTQFLLRMITRALIAMEQVPAPGPPEAQTPATAPIAPETAIPPEAPLGQESSLTVGEL